MFEVRAIDPHNVPHRGLITIAIMLATIMQVLDTTIANVALPTMTAISASPDTTNRVLTSYTSGGDHDAGDGCLTVRPQGAVPDAVVASP